MPKRVPFLRYPGSKFRIAPKIASLIPRQHDSFVVPYAGSAGVFFFKPRSRLETLNDKNERLVNLFRQLRDNRKELVRLIKLTPWSQAEHEACAQHSDDPLEDARRIYFYLWSSIQPYAKNPGFRRQKRINRKADGTGPMTAAARAFMRTDQLIKYSERLRGVQLEVRDALEIISDYDYEEAVFYCDPPYVMQARVNSSNSQYQHEYDDEDHVRLSEALNAAKGMVILSGYDHPMYRELYPYWKRTEILTRTNGGGQATEILWLNPAIATRLSEERRLHPLLNLAKLDGS